MKNEEVEAIALQLFAPFDLEELKWLPAVVKGNKALAACYLDAQTIQWRFDKVMGPDGWEDSYVFLPDGTAQCSITLHYPTRSVTRTDVGSPSDQPNAGDRTKAAYTDGYKRASKKHGVGRYILDLPLIWSDYDPQRKQFSNMDDIYRQMPTWAIPVESSDASGQSSAPTELLVDRIAKADQACATQGRCNPLDFTRALLSAGQKKGFPAQVSQWESVSHIAFVKDFVKRFQKENPIPQVADDGGDIGPDSYESMDADGGSVTVAAPISAQKEQELLRLLLKAKEIQKVANGDVMRVRLMAHLNLPTTTKLSQLTDADYEEAINAIQSGLTVSGARSEARA